MHVPVIGVPLLALALFKHPLVDFVGFTQGEASQGRLKVVGARDARPAEVGRGTLRAVGSNMDRCGLG